MTTKEKRQALLARYPHSKTWTEKVKKMPDDQVIAIYLRMISKEGEEE